MILDQEIQVEDRPTMFQYLAWGRFVMHTLSYPRGAVVQKFSILIYRDQKNVQNGI
jgi:hypothetical protein